MKYRKLAAFREGDIRGRYPEEINESFVYAFAIAFIAEFPTIKAIAIGRDARNSSESLYHALRDGLLNHGIDVYELGLCATELGYFASSRSPINAAIIITASHNPADYNGIKLVLDQGRSIHYRSGLAKIEQRMLRGEKQPRARRGKIIAHNIKAAYLQFMQAYFQPNAIDQHHQPIVLNGINGTASTLACDLATIFNIQTVWLGEKPGNIPNEGPDPLHPMHLSEMKTMMQNADYRFGVAWDGDCDRCIFFDANGDVIPTYYIIGVFIEQFLKSHPKAAIVFDTKLCLNTLDLIETYQGIPIPSQTGHAFMKTAMRKHRGIYGGELSAHHYFGDFFFCDSGMMTWLEMMRCLREQQDIQALIQQRRSQFCSIRELNLKLDSIDEAFNVLKKVYQGQAKSIHQLDGISFQFHRPWRFSIRRSKTEPLIRLNVEAIADQTLLLSETSQLLKILAPFQADEQNWLNQVEIQ